jgi:hypothetical protein
VSYSFPSAFTTFDPSKAFGGGYGNFSSVGKLTSGGGSSMIGPALGLVGSIGGSLLGGMFGNQQAADQMRMQNAIANQQIIEGRNLAYGQIASNIGGRVFGSTVAPDLDLSRQQFAKQFELGPLAERRLGLGSEESKRERLARISPESKEAAQFENRLAIQRELAARRAQTDAMFGPVRGSFA